eukprot:1359394-Pyramimonas_sp.AAC.1
MSPKELFLLVDQCSVELGHQHIIFGVGCMVHVWADVAVNGPPVHPSSEGFDAVTEGTTSGRCPRGEGQDRRAAARGRESAGGAEHVTRTRGSASIYSEGIGGTPSGCRQAAVRRR